MKKRHTLSAFTWILVGLLSISCGTSNDKMISEEKVLEFRQRVRQEQYDQIYEEASSAFKKSADKQQFTEGLKLVRSEISVPENLVLQDWKVNKDLVAGTSVILVYQTKKEGNVFLEEYAFIKENGEFLLYNYRFKL